MARYIEYDFFRNRLPFKLIPILFSTELNYSLSVNRELQLIVGEFVQQELIPESRLWFLCQSASLNRAALQSSATIHLATHTFVFFFQFVDSLINRTINRGWNINKL